MRDTEATATVRREWVKPEMRRFAAGSAEFGGGSGLDTEFQIS
jgi:hypothetical protein